MTKKDRDKIILINQAYFSHYQSMQVLCISSLIPRPHLCQIQSLAVRLLHQNHLHRPGFCPGLIKRWLHTHKKRKKRKLGGFELGTMSVQSNKPNHWSTEDQHSSWGKIAQKMLLLYWSSLQRGGRDVQSGGWHRPLPTTVGRTLIDCQCEKIKSINVQMLCGDCRDLVYTGYITT